MTITYVHRLFWVALAAFCIFVIRDVTLVNRNDRLSIRAVLSPSLGPTRIFDLGASPRKSENTIVQNTPFVPRIDVLKDPLARVHDDFDVPAELQPRVAFWYDIYTKYSAQEFVIHHMDQPWLIFEVVDTSPILNGNGHRWTKHHRAEALVKARFELITSSLKKLGRSKKIRPLDPQLASWVDLIKKLPGDFKRNLLSAPDRIRIQLGQRDFMLTAINQSTRYLHHMERIFDIHKLPVELTRLPLVESSFNISATSKVGAAGIWQIMPSIGKQFLIVQTDIDERRSPVKATGVAARLLKENFKILKAWPLAVTAYNHGPGGLLSASKRLGTNKLDEIILKNKRKGFGFATSNFYSEFLAALYAEKYKDKIFRAELLQDARVETEIFSVPAKSNLKSLAKTLEVDEVVLAELNPDIRLRNVGPRPMLPRGYELVVPKGALQRAGMVKSPQETKSYKKFMALATELDEIIRNDVRRR